MSAGPQRQTIVLPPTPFTPVPTPYVPAPQGATVQLIAADNAVIPAVPVTPVVIAANIHPQSCLADSTALNKALNSLSVAKGSSMGHTSGQSVLGLGGMHHTAPDLVTYSQYVNGSIFSVPRPKDRGSDDLVVSVYGFVKSFLGASGTNQGAIDNRIEQAMDLVKSHLMNAVRSEVEELKEKIIKLEDTISHLQNENEVLKRNVPNEVLLQIQTTNNNNGQVPALTLSSTAASSTTPTSTPAIISSGSSSAAANPPPSNSAQTQNTPVPLSGAQPQ